MYDTCASVCVHVVAHSVMWLCTEVCRGYLSPKVVALVGLNIVKTEGKELVKQVPCMADIFIYIYLFHFR